jgi:DNA polymerase epsilon subunit 1
LFLIVQQIEKKYPVYTRGEDDSVPTYSFSTRSQQKPALEFIKAIYRVLSLDKAIEDEAYKLRRNMLKLIGIGEFSWEAEWRDPCVSLVLPEVICKVCNECRDIDLCKDPNVDVSKELPCWRCPTCKTDYDTADMEMSLVDVVNRKLMAYVLQDLQCKKCQQVKDNNITTRCPCAGELKTIVDTEQTAARLRTFKELAQYFGMPLLLQNVEWILQMSPHLNSVV